MGAEEEYSDGVEEEEDDDDFFTEDDFRAAANKVAEEYEVAEMSLDDFMGLLSEQIGGVDLAAEQELIARIKIEAENGELEFEENTDAEGESNYENDEEQFYGGEGGFEDEDLVDPAKQQSILNYDRAKTFFLCCIVFLCLLIVALIVLLILDPFAEEVDQGACDPVREFVDPQADGFDFLDNRALGDSVAYSGGLVAVGAPRETGRKGAVLLFRYDNGELLNFIERPERSGDEVFGRAVAMDGDALVIAAREENTSAGRVFVYSAASGEIAYALTSPASISFDDSLSFGYTVAISGDTVLVGPEDGKGPIYTYSAQTGNLLNELQFPPNSSQPSESIDISGDNIVVGAPADEENGRLGGAVYVFSAETGEFKRKVLSTRIRLKPGIC